MVYGFTLLLLFSITHQPPHTHWLTQWLGAQASQWVSQWHPPIQPLSHCGGGGHCVGGGVAAWMWKKNVYNLSFSILYTFIYFIYFYILLNFYTVYLYTFKLLYCIQYTKIFSLKLLFWRPRERPFNSPGGGMSLWWGRHCVRARPVEWPAQDTDDSDWAPETLPTASASETNKQTTASECIWEILLGLPRTHPPPHTHWLQWDPPTKSLQCGWALCGGPAWGVAGWLCFESLLCQCSRKVVVTLVMHVQRKITNVQLLCQLILGHNGWCGCICVWQSK